MYAIELDGRHVGLNIKAQKWGKSDGKATLKDYLYKKVTKIEHNGSTVRVYTKSKPRGYYYSFETSHSLKLDTYVEIVNEKGETYAI